MHEEQLAELQEELGIYLNKPYGGLFGDNAQIKIIEEIVADHNRNYRPRYFEEMTGSSAPSIRKALNNLTSLGLLEKDISDNQHPVYRANLKSKKLIALTFLSLASIDDRDGTECMDFAVFDYYFKELKEKIHKTNALHPFPPISSAPDRNGKNEAAADRINRDFNTPQPRSFRLKATG